jgi:molecular chaperone GrpE
MTRIPIDDDQPSNLEQEEPSPVPGDQPAEHGGQANESNELMKLRSEMAQMYDKYARATAEYKNSQKRLETEFDSRLQYANSSLIKSILPTIDNFERALSQDATKVDAASILKGMQIVHDQLMAVLRSQKVEEIAPKVGEHFDPTKHEALMQQPSDQYSEPAVTQLFEKGYTLHGRTLRPAKVAVSKMA